MKEKRVREYGFDNLKFILIGFVVLGHLLAVCSGLPGANSIYRVIYSFHMPAFCFISGYFAKYSAKRIFKYSFIYIVFQMIYSLFLGYKIQFLNPTWMLWYLLVLVFYLLIIPLIDVKKKSTGGFILFICFVLSLLSGYNNNFGDFLTLSRFFSFLPFFISGYYLKKWNVNLGEKLKKKKWLIIIGVIVSITYVLMNTGITSKMLFGASSYQAESYNVGIKLQIELIASVWILFFMAVVLPLMNKEIFIISDLGKNSLSIFLLHGFFIKIIGWSGVIYKVSQGKAIVLLLLLAYIIILTGNSVVNDILNTIFSTKWLNLIVPSRRKSNLKEESEYVEQ